VDEAAHHREQITQQVGDVRAQCEIMSVDACSDTTPDEAMWVCPDCANTPGLMDYFRLTVEES
jgi:hypothetical protein